MTALSAQCLSAPVAAQASVASSVERRTVSRTIPASAAVVSPISFGTSFLGQQGMSATSPLICRAVRNPTVCSMSGLTSISLEGGPTPKGSDSASTSTSTSSSSEPEKPEEVELVSEMGIDYNELKELFEADEWKKADDWTRATLIKLAGEDAEERDWVYFSEVPTIPDADLTTLDALWRAYSGGRYGYSVQRRIWVKCKRDYAKFFKQIDWTFGENNKYRHWPEDFLYQKDAASGHFPLTSALRGTQLMEKIFEHPAIVKAEKEAGRKIKI